MRDIGVEAVFAADGSVQINRVQLDRRWLRVGQGRQWLDGDGRHCLIMLPDNSVHEIILQHETLAWVMKPLADSRQIV